MSTRYSLLNHSLRFDTTANCYPSTLAAELSGNDNGLCIAFKEASTGWLRGTFEVPSDWTAGTVRLCVVWTAPVTTNNIEWHFKYKAVNGNDINVVDVNLTTTTSEASSGAYLDGLDTAPSTSKERLTAFVDLNEAYLTADTTLLWELQRDSADAQDTLSGTVSLLDLMFDVAINNNGDVATDSIWNAAGDLAVGTGPNAATAVSISPTNGHVLTVVSGAVAWAAPTGGGGGTGNGYFPGGW